MLITISISVRENPRFPEEGESAFRPTDDGSGRVIDTENLRFEGALRLYATGENALFSPREQELRREKFRRVYRLLREPRFVTGTFP